MAVVVRVMEMVEEIRSSNSPAVTRATRPVVGVDAQPIEHALRRNDVDLTFFLWNTADSLDEWPWAWVLFPECYPLSAHLRSIREDAASMPFTLYGRMPDPLPLGWEPCVGAVLVREKKVLRAAAERSPMFDSAWAALRDCSQSSSWVCLSDALDPTWVETVRDPKGVRPAGTA